MVFSDLLFIYIFLCATLILYFLVRSSRGKRGAHCRLALFLRVGRARFMFFCLFCRHWINYVAGLLIENHRAHGKVIVALTLVFDLGMLAVFKYAGFFVENINALFGSSIPVPDIVMPIGHQLLHLPDHFLRD